MADPGPPGPTVRLKRIAEARVDSAYLEVVEPARRDSAYLVLVDGVEIGQVLSKVVSAKRHGQRSKSTVRDWTIAWEPNGMVYETRAKAVHALIERLALGETFTEAERPPLRAIPEGWARVDGTRKAHYFRQVRSLCGRWIQHAGTPLLTGDNLPAPDQQCTACQHALAKTPKVDP